MISIIDRFISIRKRKYKSKLMINNFKLRSKIKTKFLMDNFMIIMIAIPVVAAIIQTLYGHGGSNRPKF